MADQDRTSRKDNPRAPTCVIVGSLFAGTDEALGGSLIHQAVGTNLAKAGRCDGAWSDQYFQQDLANTLKLVLEKIERMVSLTGGSFHILSISLPVGYAPFAAIADGKRRFNDMQFHPEVIHTYRAHSSGSVNITRLGDAKRRLRR